MPKRSRPFLDEEVEAKKKDKGLADDVDGDTASDDDTDVDEQRQVGVFIRQIEDEILHKANVDAVVREMSKFIKKLSPDSFKAGGGVRWKTDPLRVFFDVQVGESA